MKIRDAKLLFDAGALSKCVIAPATLIEGYEIVVFMKAQGEYGGESISTKRGGARQFKTFDTAIRTASEIGYTTIEVRLE